MTTRGWFWTALVTTLVAIGPILSAMSAGAVANAAGCDLDEGSVHPCVIAGHDFGELLYSMGVMGWLMLVTIWLVPVALIFWVIWIQRRVRAQPERSIPRP